MSISGYTICRNALKLDYCIQLAIQSLLEGCDEVVIGDAESTDGTKEFLYEWASREPRLRIIDQIWPDPVGKVDWFIRWINETRQHLKCSNQLMIDADEAFDPEGFKILRQSPDGSCLTMHRFNYWKNVHFVAPHGRLCSHLVTRYGPSDLFMSSDEIYGSTEFPGPEPEIRQRSRVDMNLHIYHFGFLRKRQALIEKVPILLKAFFGQDQDHRLIEAQKHPEKHWTEFCPFDSYCLDAPVPIPEFCKPWLAERNAL